MKKLARARLPEFFAAVRAQRQLYIPALDGSGQARFLPWQEGMALAETCNTVRSAKDLFFPQVEDLVSFRVSGKAIEVVEHRDPSEPFVLFGVRACDCRSFDILDQVFLAEPKDTYYEARRKNGLIITLACTAPEETCFCTAFGIDPAAPAGDVRAFLTQESLLLEPLTEQGRALLDALPILADGGGEEAAAQQRETRKIAEKLPFGGLNLAGFTGENMLKLFHSKKWASLSEACLGCGTCTFVCPTCQCYDIREFDTGREVRRFRCWDSCMYRDFTKMSAGQPRPTQLERFRQRFMHKLVYFPSEHDGVFGCVGCGRCLQKCPIHTNIVKVAKALGEEVQ